MPDDEIAGLSVVVKAEVEQATKALTNLSRQFENTAMIAQEGAEVQEASFVDVERGMDRNLKQHKKHSEGVMGALKKIGLAWTAITGAATAGIYGLLKASSYGSLYFSQWGATTKDIANTAIKPLVPTLNDATNAYKRFADNLKEKGVWEALKISILDAIDWFNDLDLEWQAVIVTLGVLMGATAIAGVIAILPTLGAAVGAVIAVLTGPVGLVLAVTAVIAILASWWSKTEDGKRVINDLKNAWDDFKKDVKDVGYLTAAKNALSNFIDWIFSPEQWVIKDSPLDHFLRFFTEDIPNAVDGMIAYIGDISWPSIPNPFDIDWCAHVPDWVAGILGICDTEKTWEISWPSLDTSGLFDIDWCAHIPGWVAYVLGICDDKQKSDWTITWPEIPNPFEDIFDPITDFTSEAATYGGNLIDNLVSGINAHKPSLEDAVSEITNTVSGIGSGGSGSTGGGSSGSTGGSTPLCPPGTEVVRNSDGTFSHCESIPYRTGYHRGGFSSGSSSSTSTGAGIPQSSWEIVEGPPFTPEEINKMRNYDRGGYIPFTSPALVHAGEYVVPRGGTLVKEGGLPNVTINLTVNNGTQRDSKALADDISRIISTEIRRLVKA